MPFKSELVIDVLEGLVEHSAGQIQPALAFLEFLEPVSTFEDLLRNSKYNTCEKLFDYFKTLTNEPAILYAAIKSKDALKVELVFNKDAWRPWTTRAVLNSTQEIYEFLLAQGIVLDFNSLINSVKLD